MAERKARIRVPDGAARGEVVVVRALLSHPMESGFRNDQAGQPIPRHIVHRFVVRFEGEEVFVAELSPGVSANPFFQFTLLAERSGELTFEWHDDDGSIHGASARLTVT